MKRLRRNSVSSPTRWSLALSSNPTRPGFTLLEVLIALGLTVVLLSGVYGAIEMYWRYETAGRAEIAQAQLLRGLTRQITTDFNSLVMHVPETVVGSEAAAEGSSSTSSTSTGSSTGSTSLTGSSTGTSTSSGSTVTASTSPLTMGGIVEGEPPLTFGLVGTADSLSITVSQPSRTRSASTLAQASVAPMQSSDLMVISYGLAPIAPELMTILMEDLDSTRPSMGLGRRVMDLYTPEALPDGLGPESLLAYEISEVSFRYFDGTGWIDTWDSQLTGTLPTAVEFQFGLWSPPPRDRSGRRTPSNPSSPGTVTPFTHVFYIPISARSSGEVMP